MFEDLGPDTSALFLLTDVPPPEEALDVLRRFAGTVHLAHPDPQAEALMARALYDGALMRVPPPPRATEGRAHGGRRFAPPDVTPPDVTPPVERISP